MFLGFKKITNKITKLRNQEKIKERKNFYHDYINKGIRWKKLRFLLLKKFPYCYCCGTEAVQVHHKTYINFGKEKLDDLISVCPVCHQIIHNLILNEESITYSNAHIIQKQLLGLQL